MTELEKTASLVLLTIIIPSIKQGNFKLLMVSLGTENEELHEELLKGLAAIVNEKGEEVHGQSKLCKQLWDITTENYFDKEQAYLGCLEVTKYGYTYHLFDFLCDAYEPTEEDEREWEQATAEGVEL